MSINENYFESLQLNGIYRNKEDLLQYAHSQLLGDDIEPWKHSAFAFIIEWLNDSLLVIAKTSGSTGKPKAIEIRKDLMLNSALATGEALKLSEGNTALLCLSAGYIAGKMMIVRAFALKLDLWIISPSLDGFENIDFKIDFAAMVPLQVKKAFADNLNLALINKLIIGGGAVDSDLHNKILELDNIEAYSTFGMTETLSHIALKKLSPSQNSFLALSGVKLSVDSRSCLCIDAPYLNIESLQTNDVVRLIDEKQFIWLGRYDNVVNSGGLKLFPEEIEVLLENYIAEPFFLCGLSHKTFGEALVLVVENSSDRLEVQLNEIINSKLTKYNRPKKMFFVSDFEYTETGKVKRTKTIERYNLKL